MTGIRNIDHEKSALTAIFITSVMPSAWKAEISPFRLFTKAFANLFRFRSAAVFVFAAVSFSASYSLPGMSEMEKIQNLINAVEASGFIFIRNDAEYSSDKAASHMRYKLERAGGRIQTAEQFIKYIATKSSITGKPYLVRMKDGKTIPLASFLNEHLKKLNSAK